ncbi:hypothetical protein DPMN_193227 [Dreissena polymorpha]|uniref:MalT-like TPR region domain-containing protein n=1 Tax=Dreissena polymorpha TaxID=45954 RepID=A0A9D4BF82_DREPO|nr:hypothetical protein DPMN_193227 [Dreissena polymorpha]
MYHQKHDETTAMKYLQEGLEIKKKSKAADLSQIDSLINIANTYIGVGELAKATQALEESEVIVSRQYFPPLSEIATINDTWGTVYLKQGQLDKAADMFDKAAQERGTMTYGGTPHVESLVDVIKVAAKKGDYRKCIQIGKQVLLFSDNVLKQRPQTIVISDCYECLANAYEKTGNLSKAKVTLESLKLELTRLGSLHDCDSNNYQLLEIQKRLKYIEHTLQSDTFTNDN